MHVDVHSFHVERTIFDVYDALHVYVEVQNEVIYVQLVVRIRAYLRVYVHICTSTCTVNASYTCTLAPLRANCERIRTFFARLRAYMHIYVQPEHVVEVAAK